MREYGQVQSDFRQSFDAAAWSDTGKLLARVADGFCRLLVERRAGLMDMGLA